MLEIEQKKKGKRKQQLTGRKKWLKKTQLRTIKEEMFI
jgi:hypothetical protein